MGISLSRRARSKHSEKMKWIEKINELAKQLDLLVSAPEFNSETWKREFFQAINDLDGKLCTHYPTSIFNHRFGEDHLRGIIQSYRNMCSSVDEARIYFAAKNVKELQRVCFNLKLNAMTLQESLEKEENKQKKAA